MLKSYVQYQVEKFNILMGHITSSFTFHLQELGILSKLKGEWMEQNSVQHDNDPKHKVNATQERLKHVLQWPSQSADLNPIGNLRLSLKIAVNKQHPINMKDQEQVHHNEWAKITPEHWKKAGSYLSQNT